jgi:quinolinate synthase
MDFVEKIKSLKRERRAVILAHNYQRPEVQDIADFVGDSLGLSIEASKTDAEVIVFCGVYFMAETAKILSPEKTVLIPDPSAGCPMADMITAGRLREMKSRHPKAKVLCYVNTTAEVKTECDLCCTSANAVRLVQQAFAADEEIIFAPDKNLAHYVGTKTGRKFIEWEGYCPTHEQILAEEVLEQKKAHPEAEFLAHPECTPQVIALADYVVSTEGMCRRARESKAEAFIIGTEVGIIHRMKKENPGKAFYAASDLAVCPNMKRTTLRKVCNSLEGLTHRVEVPPETVRKARHAIERMLEY